MAMLWRCALQVSVLSLLLAFVSAGYAQDLSVIYTSCKIKRQTDKTDAFCNGVVLGYEIGYSQRQGCQESGTNICPQVYQFQSSTVMGGPTPGGGDPSTFGAEGPLTVLVNPDSEAFVVKPVDKDKYKGMWDTQAIVGTKPSIVPLADWKKENFDALSAEGWKQIEGVISSGGRGGSIVLGQ